MSYTVLLREFQARILLTVNVPRLSTTAGSVWLFMSTFTKWRNWPALPSLTRALSRNFEEEEEKTGLTPDHRALSWLVKT